MKISITAFHIASGVPRSSTADPLALALLAAGFDSVVTHSGYFVGSYKGAIYVRNLPPPVVDFIKTFDRGQKTEPLSFEVKL